MRCDNCGTHESVIQLTQVENNEMRVLHLCEECAVERGVELESHQLNAPLADFLAQIGKVPDAPSVGRCPSCGMTAANLRQTGRLGCALCYTHYDEHLRSLLRRLHGGTKHVGKVVAPNGGEEDGNRTARILSLRRSLQHAVEAEDFEFAASIRDQLRELELNQPVPRPDDERGE